MQILHSLIKFFFRWCRVKWKSQKNGKWVEKLHEEINECLHYMLIKVFKVSLFLHQMLRKFFPTIFQEQFDSFINLFSSSTSTNRKNHKISETLLKKFYLSIFASINFIWKLFLRRWRKNFSPHFLSSGNKRQGCISMA